MSAGPIVRGRRSNLSSRIGIRALSVYASCFFLFINLEGVDPVDYLIAACVILNIAPVIRTAVLISRHTATLIAIIAFLASYSVSVFIGGAKASFVSNFIINAGLALVLVAHCSDPIRLRRVVFSLSAGFFFSVLVAALQIFSFMPMLPGQFDVVRDSRFMGLFGDPNLLGAFSVFLSLYWVNELISRGGRSPTFLALSLVFFSAPFFTLVFTQSRSAWGGFVIAVMAYGCLSMKGFRLRQSFGAVVLTLVVIGGALIGLRQSGAAELIEERLRTATEIEDEAEAERFGLFYTAVTLSVAAVNPLGVGPGNAAGATGLTNRDGGPIAAHNAFVQVAAENGWIAAVALIYLATCGLRLSLKLGISGAAPLGMSARVMFGSLLSLVFCGMFQDLIQWKFAWVIPALFAAAMLHHQRRSRVGGFPF